jgi:uridylate kinase
MATVSEPYIRRRAVRHMEKGRVVIFAAGTGNPFFTTDTAAALRAAEMGCDALFKGTSVDGVYNADPKIVAGAKRYETITFDRVLAENLKVMDATAVALCRDNNIPIVVFNIREQGNLARVLGGDGTATVVQNEGERDARL